MLFRLNQAIKSNDEYGKAIKHEINHDVQKAERIRRDAVNDDISKRMIKFYKQKVI